MALVAITTLAGCHSSRMPYLSDAQRDVEETVSVTYGSTIATGDQLYIYVYSQNPAAVKSLNQETNHIAEANGDQSAGSVQGYTVSQQGTILFPIVGTIEAEGKSLDQLRLELEGILKQKKIVKDPVVTVKRMNFHVTVIGEVRMPQVLYPAGERITLLEALSVCGDITDDGMPNRILIARRDDDGIIYGMVDLTSSETLTSPYYYLQQNDIVYVEPKDKKKRTATRDDNIPAYITTGASIIRLAYSIIGHYYRNNRH